jgi:hypothetical protein
MEVLKMRGKKFYLLVNKVYTLIESGKTPSEICKELKISKQKLTYYSRPLIKGGFIKRIGYGCWEVLKPYSKVELKKEVKKIYRVGNNKLIEIMKLPRNTIRSHFIQFKVIPPGQVIKSTNWKDRANFLIKGGIDFKPIENLFGGGQSLTFGNVEFRLTDKSILISIDRSYFGEDIDEIKGEIIIDVLKAIKKLERVLIANFSEFGSYTIQASRQHHSLIKNAFSQIYLKSKNQYLKVTNKDGLWLIIDNSFNLNELECVHTATGITDIRGVQNFFNSLKETNFEVTPGFTLQELNAIKSRIKELEEKNERRI